LTGLRFIAAISVVLSHALASTAVAPGAADPLWHSWLGFGSAFGMSCFFVLSGFVIHYNYSDSIVDHRWRGTVNFFTARFSRLYPLYIVCIILSLNNYGYFLNLLSGQHPELTRTFGQLAPYYLTMTQSWKFSIVGNNALIYGFPFSQITQIAWSVSTELFFYLVYPLICLAMLRLSRARQIAWAIVAVSVAGFALMHLAYHNISAIDQFGVAHWGPIAGWQVTGFQDSFLRWLVYFAPYTRLPEFLLGCLCAALYRETAASTPSAREQRAGFAVAGIATIAIAALAFIMSQSPIRSSFVGFLHLNFGFALPVAALIFCAARYRNPISALLSHRVMVRCGDASYSIYMLHILIIESAGLKDLNIGLSGWLTLIVLLRLVVAILTTIGLSLVTYQLIEVPARRWLRRLLTIDLRSATATAEPHLSQS